MDKQSINPKDLHFGALWELAHTDPIVHGCLYMHRTGQITHEQAVVLMIRLLIEIRDDLRERVKELGNG